MRDYLLANPEVLEEAFKALQRRSESRRRRQKQAKAIEASSRHDLQFRRNQMVLGNPDGRDHAGRVLRLQLRLLQTRGLRHDGAARRQSRSAHRHEGIPDPVGRLGRSGAHFGRGQGHGARKIPGVPSGAVLAAGRQSTATKALEVARDLGLDVGGAGRPPRKATSVTDNIKEVHELADALGITGTPSYIIGKELVPGAHRLRRAAGEGRQRCANAARTVC